jgi:hypothetical protein
MIITYEIKKAHGWIISYLVITNFNLIFNWKFVIFVFISVLCQFYLAYTLHSRSEYLCPNVHIVYSNLMRNF